MCYSDDLIPLSSTSISEDPWLYTLSSDGFSLLGTMWRIQDFIELQPIQSKYCHGWRQIQKAGTPDSTRHRATTHILFEMIMLLKAQGKTQAADAIFNSISSARFRNNIHPTDSNNVIESIQQIPLDMKIENRGDLFSIESVSGEMPHQSWIIDRVMENGGLWLAQPADKGYLLFVEDHKPKTPTSPTEIESLSYAEVAAIQAHRWSTLMKKGQVQKVIDENSDLSLIMTFLRDSGYRMGEQSHAQKMLQASLFRQVLNIPDEGYSFVFTDNPWKETLNKDAENSEPTKKLPRMIAMERFAFLLASQSYASEFLDRRAIFDIGGDSAVGTLVLTPFQGRLESIPRPKLRDLSVSWIVEEVDAAVSEGTNKNENKAEVPRLRVKGMVKGMWRYTFFHSGRFTLI